MGSYFFLSFICYAQVTAYQDSNSIPILESNGEKYVKISYNLTEEESTVTVQEDGKYVIYLESPIQ